MERKLPVTVTREALYELIWATPIDRLAKDYGISGRGLQKICERLTILTPPRGYWAKLAAGKNVVKFRLPPAKDDTLLEATIRPTSQPEPPPPVVEERHYRLVPYDKLDPQAIRNYG